MGGMNPRIVSRFGAMMVGCIDVQVSSIVRCTGVLINCWNCLFYIAIGRESTVWLWISSVCAWLSSLQIGPFLFLFLLRNSITVLQIQILHHPVPGSCCTLGQLRRRFRIRICHTPVEQFHADPALNT